MTRMLVLALVLAHAARPALACRRDEISLAQAFTLADAVFVGRVDVFAGNGRGDCSFGRVDADRRYLFMASAPAPGTLVLEIGRGTARATPAQLGRVSALFGAPTPPR